MYMAMKTVLSEVAANLKRVWRLTLYEKRAKNSELMLGNLWEILNPLLNILVYWFVFAVGLRNKIDYGANYPYVVWLISGLVPWLTISATMTHSASCMVSAASLIKSCNIPLSIFPLKSVMHGMINHLFTMLILFAMVIIFRIPLTLHIFEIIYYTGAMLVFLFSFALVTSSVNVFFSDLQKLLPAILRLLMYASSVVINIANFPENIQFFLRLNPLVHLVEGIRFCLLDGKGVFTHAESFVSFWVITLAMFAAGCLLHVRLRDRFIDVL